MALVLSEAGTQKALRTLDAVIDTFSSETTDQEINFFRFGATSKPLEDYKALIGGVQYFFCEFCRLWFRPVRTEPWQVVGAGRLYSACGVCAIARENEYLWKNTRQSIPPAMQVY